MYFCMSRPAQDAWFQLACVRTSIVGELDVGIAGVADRIMDLFWPTGNDSDNFSTSGITLPLSGKCYQIRMRLGIFIFFAVAMRRAKHCSFARCARCIVCQSYKRTLYMHTRVVPTCRGVDCR